MSRIPFLSALFLFLIVSVATNAQERGDGEAAAKRQIHDKDIIDGRGRRSIRRANHDSHVNAGKNTKGVFRKFGNDDAKSEPPETPHGRSELGAKLGVNFQELAKSPFSPAYKPGVVGGGYFKRYFRRTGIRMELFASTGSYSSQNPAAYYAQHTANMDTVTKSSFKALYISVPILFEQRMFHKAYLQIGPDITYLLSSSDKNGQFTKIYTKSDIFKKAEFSILFGAEYQLPYNIRVGARYIKGLTDVNNSVYPKAYFAWTINSLQVMASYTFFQSKPRPVSLVPGEAKEKKNKKKENKN